MALPGAALVGQRGFVRRSRRSSGRASPDWVIHLAGILTYCRSFAPATPRSKVTSEVSAAAGTVLPWAASAGAPLSPPRGSTSRDKVVRGPPWENISYFHGDKNKTALPGQLGRAVSPPSQGLSSLVWNRREINFYRGEMEHRKSPTHLSASFGA